MTPGMEMVGRQEESIGMDIASLVGAKVRRVFWTNDKVDRMFARRSAKEIMDEGETFYMNPCLDLTLASSAMLGNMGLAHTLVIEEHKPTPEFPLSRLHFVIEYQQGNQTYHLNYETLNRVKVGRGVYPGHAHLEGEIVKRINGSSISPDSPLHVNLGLKSLDDLSEMFAGYQLKPQLEKLKKDNTTKNYQAYFKRCGEDLDIEVVN